MTEAQPTAAELARRVADALEASGLSYAIGGALALGFYAAPRATIDVDVNIFADPSDGIFETLQVLSNAGFVLDGTPAEALRQARSDGQFRGWMSGLRVDVFVPAIPYYAELELRRQEVVLLDRPLWILGPADLAVLKMMFYRRKDLADVEALARELGAALDRGFVGAKLTELVGEDDERLAAWADILRDVDQST